MTATSGHNNECSNKPQRYSTQDPRQHSNQQDRLGFFLDYGWSFTRFHGWKQKWWQLLQKKKENYRNLGGKYFKQRFTQVFEYTKRTIELFFISGTLISLLNKKKVTFGMSRCLFLLTAPTFPDLPYSPLTFSPFSSPVPVPYESKYQVAKPVHRNETESNIVMKQTQLFFN